MTQPASSLRRGVALLACFSCGASADYVDDYNAQLFLEVSSWVEYPGSTAGATITGSVFWNPIVISQGVFKHRLTWNLNGTDDACPTGTGNVCGIHIHEGTDCSDASTLGGHNYLGSISETYSGVLADPWPVVRYSSTDGKAFSSVGHVIDIKLPSQGVLNKAVVIHNSVGAGERIACGILKKVQREPPLSVSKWMKYPGSTWRREVTGGVSISHVPSVAGTVEVSWQIQGIDDACPTGVGNECGIHIHEGTSCDTNEAIGGHHWNRTLLSADPWVATRYRSDSAGGAVTGYSALPPKIVTGFDFASLKGHAVVVHNAQGLGDRIACGILVEGTYETVVGMAVSSAFTASVSMLLMSAVAFLLIA